MSLDYILNIRTSWAREGEVLSSRVVSNDYLANLLPKVIAPPMDASSALEEIEKMSTVQNFKAYSSTNGYTLEIFKFRQRATL